jgi:Ion transport protein
MKDISNIVILMTIFIYTYMLIGMEMFAYKAKFNPLTHKVDLSDEGKFPRFNFNNPLNSFISVFIVLANDGWSEIYYDHCRATDPVSTSFYFMSLLIIGQFIILNLFIAILIENFDQLSIRNDFKNKLHKLRDIHASEKLYNCICCLRGKVAPHASTIIDDLINGNLQNQIKMKDNREKQEPSLLVFEYTSKFRQFARRWVKHKYFEWIMLAVILISTV